VLLFALPAFDRNTMTAEANKRIAYHKEQIKMIEDAIQRV
jgi:hypothetical protein